MSSDLSFGDFDAFGTRRSIRLRRHAHTNMVADSMLDDHLGK